MKTNVNISELQVIARSIRATIIDMSCECGVSHLGSSLSCIDILVALYWTMLVVDPAKPDLPDRDRFILSKGHAASALFATLAYKGFFPKKLLNTIAKPGSSLEEHPGPNFRLGVEAATGSLGHGLSLGVGMALAARILDHSFRTCVLLSDGECNEGSVWEAAMFASGQKLNSILAIVDFNKWQATGRSCEVMGLEPLKQKWEAFGWRTIEIDGHDMESLVNTLVEFSTPSDKPMAIIANTVKGKGVSFMEDDNNWHYRIPTREQAADAKNELGIV